MAYNRQVVWKSPFSNQFLPQGEYGMRYTEILVDVPLENLKHEIWDVSNTLEVAEIDTEQFIRLQTSVAYTGGTLKVYQDSELASYKESRRRKKRAFDLDKQLAKGKHIYCSYIPSDHNLSIGDNRTKLESVYGVVAAVRYSSKLRETVHLCRRYVDAMCNELEIEPPLWIGGKGNEDRGIRNNLLPSLTPVSSDLHLKPIRDKIREISEILRLEGVTTIPFLKEEEFTVEWIEELQKILIDIDIILSERS